MVEILSREQCGLVPPDTSRLSFAHDDTVVGVTVHCTVTPTKDPVRKWREIQAQAMAGTLPSGDHYGDTPYNDGITLDGRILAGRSHSFVGAHAKSTHNLANRVTIGVAVIGDGKILTDPAKAALRVWLYLWTLEYGRRPQLFDHKDWLALGGIATACPDPPTIAFVNRLRLEARAGH